MQDRIRDSIARIALLLACACIACQDSDGGTQPEVPVQTLVTGLDTPWDLVWGPDAMLWVSERGGRISRVDPVSGARTTVGQLAVAEVGEGGLLGIALHPDYPTQSVLYAVHSYASNGTKNRLVRVPIVNGALGTPSVLLDNIPGASIHNGARIVIGPDRLLYISMGDAGNGAAAQDLGSYSGKILRLTLDGAPAPGNPFSSAVYSFGHRNPQGLVFAPSGALYSTEHGPDDNDEVNRIVAGRNYGWPDVRGFCDTQSERSFCQAHDVVEPLAAWTPTIAPCGMDLYTSNRNSGWNGSLLFTTLKAETLYRLSLSADGARVTASEQRFAGRFGRLRDVLVGPNGEVYLATSNRDGRGNPAGDDDRILRFTP